MSTHPDVCRCRLHQEIEQRQMQARRHAAYRQLASAILGPEAPRADAQLVRALAAHASVIRSTSNLAHLSERRAA
jgi:hypothetical protein